MGGTQFCTAGEQVVTLGRDCATPPRQQEKRESGICSTIMRNFWPSLRPAVRATFSSVTSSIAFKATRTAGMATKLRCRGGPLPRLRHGGGHRGTFPRANRGTVLVPPDIALMHAELLVLLNLSLASVNLLFLPAGGISLRLPERVTKSLGQGQGKARSGRTIWRWTLDTNVIWKSAFTVKCSRKLLRNFISMHQLMGSSWHTRRIRHSRALPQR